jgi:hypothetical protein
VKASCRAGDSITVFRPHSSVPIATLQRGVFHPRALAVSSQLLYVANAPPNGSKKLPLGSVAVYNTSSFKLVRTITDGIDTPVALATGTSGRLYVANLNGPNVSVYEPGSNGRPSRIITQGVTSPRALAIGSDYGGLYVANFLEGTVSAYYAGSNTPRFTIPGLALPISLALGPYYEKLSFFPCGPGTERSTERPHSVLPLERLYNETTEHCGYRFAQRRASRPFSLAPEARSRLVLPIAPGSIERI